MCYFKSGISLPQSLFRQHANHCICCCRIQIVVWLQTIDLSLKLPKPRPPLNQGRLLLDTPTSESFYTDAILSAGSCRQYGGCIDRLWATLFPAALFNIWKIHHKTPKKNCGRSQIWRYSPFSPTFERYFLVSKCVLWCNSQMMSGAAGENIAQRRSTAAMLSAGTCRQYGACIDRITCRRW